MTEDQQYCLDALAWWFGNLAYLPQPKAHGTGISIRWSRYKGNRDFGLLEKLVLAANAADIDIELRWVGPTAVTIIAKKAPTIPPPPFGDPEPPRIERFISQAQEAQAHFS